MEFKSGCVVVALILISAVFLSGCINQDSQSLDTLEKSKAEELNNQSTPTPIATPAQITTESPVDRIKRERANLILTPTPTTPIDTIQYTPVPTAHSSTPTPVPTTPHPILIMTPTPIPTLTPNTTQMPSPNQTSTPKNTEALAFDIYKG
jgi:hypothetical protein